MNDTSLQPKVSVTVPVYNTGQYLRECLDSLASQTLDELEVIIVDDGSTDCSNAIIREYCTRYPNFRFIEKENGGLASARQAGLEAARGEYVIVCDSDDWTDPDMYRILYEEAIRQNADIAVCGMYAEYDSGKRVPFNSFVEDTDGIADNDRMLAVAPGMSYTKLVRRSLFHDSDASYEDGINMSEDVLIFFKLLRSKPRIAQVRKYLYHWRRVFAGKSYTNSIKMRHVRQMQFTYDWIKENYTDRIYSGIIRQRAIDIAFACLRTTDFEHSYLRGFMRSELSWKNLLYGNIGLKTLVVASAKSLPASFVRFMVRKLYPLFYK